MHDRKECNHSCHNVSSSIKVLLISVVITFVFALIEAGGGYFSGSLALLGDAGHMLADSFSLVIAVIAAWLFVKPPSKNHSYGLGRIEVITACASSIFLMVIVIEIAISAVHRFYSPEHVNADVVMIIGALGLFVNIIVALVLHRGEQNLNTRAAILHVLSDLLGSAAALCAGIIIYFTGWMQIDPILSLLICVLIIISSFRLLRDAFHVLMEGVPVNVDIAEVGNSMVAIDNVLSVHDLHVWTLSSRQQLLSAHIEIENFEQWAGVYKEIASLLQKNFNIRHITIQPETTNFLQVTNKSSANSCGKKYT